MIDFPDSPTDGTTYAYGGVSYIYNEPLGIWVIYDSLDAPESSYNTLIHKVYVGITAPTTPVNGTLWYDTDNGHMLIYLDDGDSTQWIQV